MERKTENIVTDIIRIRKDLNELKTNQRLDINLFKILEVFEISMDITKTDPIGTGSVYKQTQTPHGLGGKPGHLAFIEVDPDIVQGAALQVSNLSNPAITYATVGGQIEIISISTVSVNSTHVVLATQLGRLVPAGTFDISARVYILRETAV